MLLHENAAQPGPFANQIARGAIVAATLLAGCSALTGIDSSYPETWPRVTTTPTTCAPFAGEYRNRGLATYAPLGGSEFLAYRFGMNVGSRVADMNAVTSVRVACDGDRLIVEGISGAAAKHRVVLKHGDGSWTIAEGKIHFPRLDLSIAEALGGTVEYAWFTLAVAEDGSLIGEEVQRGASMALWVIPLGGRQTFWFRWNRVGAGTARSTRVNTGVGRHIGG